LSQIDYRRLTVSRDSRDHRQGRKGIVRMAGRIWVATRLGVPSRGSRVGAKGYVHNGFNFAGRSFGTVLEETDRRSR